MDNLLQRITFNQNVLGGKPVIRGLRISVEMILDILAKGGSKQEILEDYPDLEPEDISAALLYGHQQIVLLSLYEFNTRQETAYLLSNPANAAHIRQSIAEAQLGKVVERELCGGPIKGKRGNMRNNKQWTLK